MHLLKRYNSKCSSGLTFLLVAFHLFSHWCFCAERSFVLWYCCRSGEYQCMEVVRPWQRHIFMFNIWCCEKGHPRCYWPINKQSVLLPILNIVWALLLCFQEQIIYVGFPKGEIFLTYYRYFALVTSIAMVRWDFVLQPCPEDGLLDLEAYRQVHLSHSVIGMPFLFSILPFFFFFFFFLYYC